MDRFDQTPRGESLARALAAIREGDLDQARLAHLSDLSREGARSLATAWALLPESIRIDLVRRCEELAEERVELNFGRALRVAMDDPSPVVRQLAISGLWEDESSEMLTRLRQTLRADDSADVRGSAAAALERFSTQAAAGRLDEPTAGELREELLLAASAEDSPYGVKRRALEALGPFGADPAVASLISDAYESGDHGLQCSALYAMGRSLDPRWLLTILAELESDEPELKFEAARAAGQLGSADALLGLLAAARDDDAEVRHAAIGAIAEIGGRGAVRALERLAEDAGEADLELIESAIDDTRALLDPFTPDS
jgi:HEAT repeat protein